MRKRGRIQILFLSSIVILFLTSIIIDTRNYAQENPITYVVQRGTVQETLTFTGIWLPRDQQELFFEIPGTIQNINVLENDLVTTGTLLMSYDVSTLQQQLEQARIDLANAQASATVNGNSTAITNAQFSLADANLDLQGSLAGAPYTRLNNALLSLEQAKDNLADAERDYNNAIGDPTNSPSNIDSAYENVRDAERDVSQAQNNYWAAAQNYAQFEIGIQRDENRVLREQIDLQQAIQNSGNNSSQDDINEAQTRISQLTSDISQASLVAPFDGIVLDISVNRGNQVEAFQNTITLAIPEPKQVFANLAIDDVQRLTADMVGVCQLLNQPETAVQCAVRDIPQEGALGSVRIAATLATATQGQIIEVSMPIGISEDALWLPPEAIRTFQNRTFVVLQTPTGESVMDVVIGLRTTERVEILSGLNEGDIVIQQ